VNDVRDGHGRLDTCDGSIIVGNFGHSQVFAESGGIMPVFRNPYRDGPPLGLGEMTLGVGGFFRGSMVNGRINGYGEYQSGFNEIKVGIFKNGVLHGHKSMHINLSGETFTGL
jgi:hypothetical protein